MARFCLRISSLRLRIMFVSWVTFSLLSLTVVVLSRVKLSVRCLLLFRAAVLERVPYAGSIVVPGGVVGGVSSMMTSGAPRSVILILRLPGGKKQRELALV